MDQIYMTAFPQGRANLDQMANSLIPQYSPTYLGEYLGATAMVPKLVINPVYGKPLGFKNLEGLLQFIGEANIHVYHVVGDNIADFAFDLRKQLGLRKPGLDRVHLARTLKELAVVEYAKIHNSTQTANYILKHFSEEDLQA
ncbi:MAG: hypothetical protein V1859_00825 [archaeon]